MVILNSLLFCYIVGKIKFIIYYIEIVFNENIELIFLNIYIFYVNILNLCLNVDCFIVFVFGEWV